MNTGFSKIVHFSDLASGTKRYKISLEPEQRQQVAAFLDLITIEKLDGFMELTGHAKTRLISLSGTLDADVSGRCVVTGKAVPQAINVKFRRQFTEDPDQAQWDHDDEDVHPSGVDDPPDLVENDEIDIGFVLIEELSLDLDPYPHAPEAKNFVYQEDRNSDAETPPDRENPFAVLKKLKE